MLVNSLSEGQGSISVSSTCVQCAHCLLLIRQEGYFRELVRLKNSIQGLPNETYITRRFESIISLL